MNQLDQLKAIISEIESTQIQDAAALETFRIRFLGSKNILKPLSALIRDVPNEQKKEFGQLVNEAKQKADELFLRYQEQLAGGASHKNIVIPDLSLPETPFQTGSRHPVSIVMEEIIDVFARMGFEVAEDREIEDDWHNFTAMNTPPDHPARDMQDTYYLASPPGWLLRTHTSSVQARVMTSRKPPIRIIAPGRVYRNETVSARSHCQFHQVEVLYVDEGVSFADMKQTLHQFAQALYGKDVVSRLRPSYFPFTEPSAEMDVYYGLADEHAHRITKGTGWLEILGCGMVDPTVLETCGIDSTKYSGFACGMGIERQAMIKYRINDIRLLFENDVRFLKQFSAVV
ncbi:MAG: phenylalanine--tRNA ligase subunit alpha [Saprospiraceae bacterium]